MHWLFSQLRRRQSAKMFQQMFCLTRNGQSHFSQWTNFKRDISYRLSNVHSGVINSRLSLHQSSLRGNILKSGRRYGSDLVGGKAKETKPPVKRNDFRRLLSLAKPEKYRIAGAVGLLIISSSVTMAVPFCMGKVIDIIYTASQEGNMTDRLREICQVLVVVFLCGAAANSGRVYLMLSSGQRIIKRLRERIFGSLMKQEISFFDKSKTGELINRLSTDTSLVGQSVTMNVSDGLRSVAQAIGSISMMFYVSPKLATVALGVVPPVAVIAIVYGRYVRKITKKVQDSLADATEVAEERISNVRVVRAFTQEEKETAAYTSQIDKVLNFSMNEAVARGFFWGFTGLSGNLIVLTVFYKGGMMMNEAVISVGDLSAFLLYAAYVGVSIGGLSSFYTELMRGVGASVRLWELADRVPAISHSGGQSLPAEIKGSIEFKDIHFTYPTRSKQVIFSDLNLSVPPGSLTAVVGASGSGKSTLAALILRFYDPNQGSVILDGIDIRDINPISLRQHIGTVSQEPVLFSCTIAENIAYGALEPSQVTTEEIVEAAKKANAYNFIQAFPDGFDTKVGEKGLMLSGGQKQRVAIARAILKNPRILLLDEATSALDSKSEHLIQETLERLMPGHTVITIAHRLSTIRNADQIVVLDKGSVAEIGTYNQLINIPEGIFKKLVEKQALFHE